MIWKQSNYFAKGLNDNYIIHIFSYNIFDESVNIHVYKNDSSYNGSVTEKHLNINISSSLSFKPNINKIIKIISQLIKRKSLCLINNIENQVHLSISTGFNITIMNNLNKGIVL